MNNRIQGTTKLLGLLGHPVQHSISPQIHNSACDKNGADYVYLCFDVEPGDDRLAQAVAALKTLGVRGANITFPFKSEIVRYLDVISPEVELIGTCNTLVVDPETKKITGHNTDGDGFILALEEEGAEFRGKKVILAGAGGAGRAIGIMLALRGAGEIVIAAPHEKPAVELIETIQRALPNFPVRYIHSNESSLKTELQDASLLINASPLGFKGMEELSIIEDSASLSPEVFVYDIVYSPAETKLMRIAKEAGCRTANGLSMLLWQGAVAYKYFTGMDMPMAHVKENLKK